MALPSHPNFLAVKASSATAVAGDELGGGTSVTYDEKVDLLDVTDFKDTTGCKLKLAALRDGSISLDGDFDYTNAPQALLWTSLRSGASVWATLQFNPSGGAGLKGFQVECKVESLNVKGEVAGKNTYSATLQFTGAPVAV